MKTIALTLSIILLCVVAVFADGIPVMGDKKAVRGEYIRIALDRKQTVDVETKRAITLRPEQMARLEKVAGGPLGEISVYSSRYNMCTCFDTDVMAIWTGKGVLDFPHEWLFTREEQERRKKEEAEDIGDDFLGDTTMHGSLIIIFDSHGEMYVGGKHQTVRQVESRIDTFASTQQERSSQAVKLSVIFDPPPPISERTDKRTAEKFRRITAYCEKRNIDTQDWGVEERLR